MQVTEFEFIDHGIDNHQYFQGCGVYNTPYEHCYTGAGCNIGEAVDDCIEQMASSGVADQTNWDDFQKELLKDCGLKKWPKRPTTKGEEMYYYISIRFNVG